MTNHQFRDATALQFAKDLNLLVDGPAPTGPTPPPAQTAPPTPPPVDDAQGDDGEGGGDEERFHVAMFATPAGGADYRSEISMAASATPLAIVTAVLQVASGTLAQLGIRTHLFATNPFPTVEAAPTPPYRPEDFRPTPADVAAGRCTCPVCTARNAGGQR